MRILAMVVLAAGTVMAAQPASAQTYDPAFPFCMRVVPWGGGTYEDCTYYTMGQCQASASGRAAQCNPNPFYAGGPMNRYSEPAARRPRDRRTY